MAIKHYGLDRAEIEDLEAKGKTDEEISAANRQRAKEQIEEEESVDDVDADEKSIRDAMPHIPSVVATFINQRYGSPRGGMEIPKGVLSVDAYFKGNPGAVKGINEASKGAPIDAIDFSIGFPKKSDREIEESGIDYNVTAFLTDLIVGAMRAAGVTDPTFVTNPFLD